MIEWKCDRCAKKYTDNGVRMSRLDNEWTSYYLAKVTQDNEKIERVVHYCEHCAALPTTIEVTL
jgi:hypothetical protein